MPLSPTDINSVATKLITTYQLENYPGIYVPENPPTPASGNMIDVVAQADLHLEEKYPDIYVGDLNDPQFNQIRELLVMCRLFQYYPIYGALYIKNNSITSVRNSAGSSVSYGNGQASSAFIDPKTFCSLYVKALAEIQTIETSNSLISIISPANWCKDQHSNAGGSAAQNKYFYSEYTGDGLVIVNNCNACNRPCNTCNCC